MNPYYDNYDQTEKPTSNPYYDDFDWEDHVSAYKKKPGIASRVASTTAKVGRQAYQSVGEGAGDAMLGIATQIEHAPVLPPPHMTLGQTRDWGKYHPETVEAVKRGDTIGKNELSDMLRTASEAYPGVEEGRPLGVISDMINGILHSAPSIPLTKANPVAGLMLIYAHLAGNKYKQYIEEGKDEDTAFKASQINAMINAPIELAGNVLQIGKIVKILDTKGISKALGPKAKMYLKTILENALIEGSEELLQEQGELISDEYANNPDANPVELANTVTEKFLTIEHAKRSGQAFGVGFGGSVLMTGAGVMGRIGQDVVNKKGWIGKESDDIIAIRNRITQKGIELGRAPTQEEVDQVVRDYRDSSDLEKPELIASVNEAIAKQEASEPIDVLEVARGVPTREQQIARDLEVRGTVPGFQPISGESAQESARVFEETLPYSEGIEQQYKRSQRGSELLKRDLALQDPYLQDIAFRIITGEQLDLTGLNKQDLRSIEYIIEQAVQNLPGGGTVPVREGMGLVTERPVATEITGLLPEEQRKLPAPEPGLLPAPPTDVGPGGQFGPLRRSPIRQESSAPILMGELSKGDDPKNYTGKELRQIAKERGFEIPKNMVKKSDMIEFIKSKPIEQQKPIKVQRSSEEAGDNTLYQIIEGENEGSTLLRPTITQSPGKYDVDETLMPIVAEKAKIGDSDLLLKDLERLQKKPTKKTEDAINTVDGKTPQQHIQDIINNTEATEKEVLAEKKDIKEQLIAGVKTGEFDGAVRFGTMGEVKAILKQGQMPISTEHGVIHAQPIMGKDDDVFVAYGNRHRHNVAIVFPKDAMIKKLDAHTKEVLIDDKVDVNDLKFLIAGHKKAYTFSELKGMTEAKQPVETKTETPVKEAKTKQAKEIYYSATQEGKPIGKYLYLTTSPEYAKNFGDDIRRFKAQPKKTLDLTEHKERSVSFEKLQSILKKEGIEITDSMREQYDDTHKPLWQWLRKYPAMVEAIKKTGYDSVKQTETFTGKGKQETTLLVIDSSIASQEAIPETKQTHKSAGNIESEFIETVKKQFGFTDTEARTILSEYKKGNVVEIDPASGQFILSSDQYWNKEAMQAILDSASIPTQSSEEISRQVSEFFKGDKKQTPGQVYLDKGGVKYFNTSREIKRGVKKGRIEVTLTNGSKVIVRPEQIRRMPGEEETGPVFLKETNRDKEYLELAKDPEKNRDKLQEMVNEAATEAGYTSTADYRLRHSAPDSESDISLDKAMDSDIMPKDYWEEPQYYQDGAGELSSFYKIKEAIELQKEYDKEGKGRKVRLRMYRAVPKTVKDEMFRNGDWISPSREYAKQEGLGIPGGYKIISRSVKISDIYWDANSINEFGYDDKQNYAYKNTKHNRKLLDPVTYTETGEVIPLSKRFKHRDSSPRFQKESGDKNLFDSDLFFPKEADLKADQAYTERLTSAKKTGITLKGAQNVVGKVKAAFPNIGEIEVLPKQADIPEEVIKRGGIKSTDKVFAYYDPVQDKIYVIHENMNSPDTVIDAILHEGIGHRGVDSILTKENRRELFRMVERDYKDTDIGKKIIKDYRIDFNNPQDRVTFSREVIAHMTNQPKATLLDRIVAFIRDIIRKFRPSLKVTDSEIKSLLRRSAEFAREGRGTFSRGEPVYSVRKTADIFYSALEQGVDNLKQEVATPEQWQGMINKLPVRAEELEWIGLSDWLKEQEGKVTKKDILDYIRANNVQVKEVIKSQDMLDLHDSAENEVRERLARKNLLTDEIGDLFDDWRRSNYSQEVELKINEYLEDNGFDPLMSYAEKGADNDLNVKTLYSEWQMPGGENYTEILLTMPVERVDITAPDGHIVKGAIKPYSTYTSSHWDEPNVLAHVRFNERKMPNGEKVLFLEEVQSDWAQEGRRKGFEGDKEPTIKQFGISFEGGPPNLFFNTRQEAQDRIDQIKEDISEPLTIQEVMRPDRSATGGMIPTRTPNMPFKKSWPMLVIKRMVRYAAENGFDSIAWTPGEVQAERYDLSKHISRIFYSTYDNGETFHINAKSIADDSAVLEGNCKADELENIVGKEVAQKIINGEGKNDPDLSGVKYLSGLDLKVGGEGMKGFYDKILPSEVNKFFNKPAWGKAKVGTIEIPIANKAEGAIDISRIKAEELLNNGYTISGTYRIAGSGENITPDMIDKLDDFREYYLDYRQAKKAGIGTGKEVWHLPITPEMKEKALYEGMPAFQRETTIDDLTKDLHGEITKESKLAKRTEAEALVDGMIDEGWDNLVSYKTKPEWMKTQSEKAVKFLNENWEKAKKIALGEETSPEGIEEGFIWKAVKLRAFSEGNNDLVYQLATESGIPELGSKLGQRIKAFDESSNIEDPEVAIREVGKFRKDKNKRQGKKVVSVKKIKELKEKLDEAEAKLKEYEGKTEDENIDATIDRLIEKSPKRLYKKTNSRILKEQIKNSLDQGLSEISTDIQALAKYFITQGVTERNALVKEVHNVIKDVIPGITIRETMDAILGYGKFKPLNKDEILGKSRDLRAQLQQVEKLKDTRKDKTPSDEERRLIKQVEEMKKELGIETIDPEKQLKSSLDAVKTRLTNEIKDLEYQIATKQKIVKARTNLKYDAEANRLQKRRDDLKKQFHEIFGSEITDQQRINAAIKATEKAIVEYTRMINENDLMPKAKRTPVQSEELNKARKERDRLKAQVKELRDLAKPKRTPEEIATQRLETRLKNEIKKLTAKLENLDLKKDQRQETVLSAEGRKLKAQRDDLKTALNAAIKASGIVTREEASRLIELSRILANAREEAGTDGYNSKYGAAKVAFLKYIDFLKGTDKTIKEMLTGEWEEVRTIWKDNKAKAFTKSIMDIIVTVSDLSISLLATLDNSFLGRQGLNTLLTRPSIWLRNSAKSFVDIYKTMKSKHGGEMVESAVMADAYSRPNYRNGDYDIAKLIPKTEEQFPTSIPERIPFAGRLFKASENAFTNSGIRMRIDTYDLLKKIAIKQGVDVKDKLWIQETGKLINSITARGDLGRLGSGGPLRLIFWAPKMLWGNVNVLTAHFGGASLKHPFARQQARRNLLKIVGYTVLIAAIADAIGRLFGKDDVVEWNPISSDFMKIKVNNTRHDITAGKGSIITLLARALTFRTKSTKTKRITKLNSGKFGSRSLFDVIIDFMANKSAPLTKTAIDIARGRNFDYEKPGIGNVAYNLATPIGVQNFVETYQRADELKDIPVEEIIADLLDLVGINTDTYDSDVEMRRKYRALRRESR